jgi:hypothetical protein
VAVPPDVQTRPNPIERARFVQQLALLDTALSELKTGIANRLAASVKNLVPLPRMVELCRAYHFSQKEMDLFQMMVVSQGSNNSIILNSMLEEDYLRKMSAYQRLSGVSEVDIDLFCDAER